MIQVSPIKRLFIFMGAFSTRLYLSSCASVLNKILDLMPPLLVAWVIDSVSGNPPSWIAGRVTEGDTWGIAILLSGLAVLIFALESLFQWAYSYGFMTLAQKAQHSIRMEAYHHIPTLG